MAHESYSLGEVAELLGKDIPDIVQMVQHGAFPGRFLTEELEMRIPVMDVRRILERGRAKEGASALAGPAGETRALVREDREALRSALETWWEEERATLREVLAEVLERRDEQVDALRQDVSAVRHRLDELARDVRRVLGVVEGETSEGWAWSVEEADGGLAGLLEELKALEAAVGLAPVDD
ncbi:MAG: hypothetical protein ACFB9M_05925 [Myxococcota bacterium]